MSYQELRQREKELAQGIQRKPGGNMQFPRAQFEAAATKFFQENPDQFKKYFSPTLLEVVVNAMQLPSVVSAKIAFTQLVQDGTLRRQDGGSEETDIAAAAEQARATIARIEAEVAAQPLTKDDCEYFASLSPRQLADFYFGTDGSAVNFFAAKYRAAAKIWGFRLPERFPETPACPEWAEGLV